MPCFHHAAMLHDGDAVGDLRDDAEIVGDEQNRGSLAPLQIADELQDLRLRRHIEGRRRLVRDQHPRLERQRHGDHGPLALAAGKFMRIGPARAFRVGDVDVSQKIQDATLDFGSAEAPYGSSNISPIWSPIVRRGLSAVIGSWKIMPIRAPRMARISSSLRAREIVPFEHDRARPSACTPSGKQSEDRARRHRLARAAFADEAQDLVGIEVRTRRRRAHADGRRPEAAPR